ncbi:MAG: thiamine-phosphate kinase [Betaproteobacteria bacterium]|nr:thiamine-phosphate kinase [Betaproteobacteria bacterium]
MTSEFDLIQRYFTRQAKSVVLGIGDDCALVRPPGGMGMAITTDMLCEGTHFFADVDPQSLGHKTLAVNLSDIAAMGADPRWATLAVALPRIDEAWLAEFTTGFFALAERFGVELIGGDTTKGPLTLSLTMFGTYPLGHALRRDGAGVGDDLWVSGETGGAALAVAHRHGRVHLPAPALAYCNRRLDWPEPRVELGRALRDIATSAIDVSDGLVADARHLCERSKVDARINMDLLPVPTALQASGIDRAIVCQAILAGGDDYELAFTAPAAARSDVLVVASRIGLVLTRIGSMVAGSGSVHVSDMQGLPIHLAAGGFDHFR